MRHLRNSLIALITLLVYVNQAHADPVTIPLRSHANSTQSSLPKMQQQLDKLAQRFQEKHSLAQKIPQFKFQINGPFEKNNQFFYLIQIISSLKDNLETNWILISDANSDFAHQDAANFASVKNQKDTHTLRVYAGQQQGQTVYLSKLIAQTLMPKGNPRIWINDRAFAFILDEPESTPRYEELSAAMRLFSLNKELSKKLNCRVLKKKDQLYFCFDLPEEIDSLEAELSKKDQETQLYERRQHDGKSFIDQAAWLIQAYYKREGKSKFYDHFGAALEFSILQTPFFQQSFDQKILFAQTFMTAWSLLDFPLKTNRMPNFYRIEQLFDDISKNTQTGILSPKDISFHQEFTETEQEEILKNLYQTTFNIRTPNEPEKIQFFFQTSPLAERWIKLCNLRIDLSKVTIKKIGAGYFKCVFLIDDKENEPVVLKLGTKMQISFLALWQEYFIGKAVNDSRYVVRPWGPVFYGMALIESYVGNHSQRKQIISPERGLSIFDKIPSILPIESDGSVKDIKFDKDGITEFTNYYYFHGRAFGATAKLNRSKESDRKTQLHGVYLWDINSNNVKNGIVIDLDGKESPLKYVEKDLLRNDLYIYNRTKNLITCPNGFSEVCRSFYWHGVKDGILAQRGLSLEEKNELLAHLQQSIQPYFADYVLSVEQNNSILGSSIKIVFKNSKGIKAGILPRQYLPLLCPNFSADTHYVLQVGQQQYSLNGNSLMERWNELTSKNEQITLWELSGRGYSRLDRVMGHLTQTPPEQSLENSIAPQATAHKSLPENGIRRSENIPRDPYDSIINKRIYAIVRHLNPEIPQYPLEKQRNAGFIGRTSH